MGSSSENPFATEKGDKSAMRPIVNILWLLDYLINTDWAQGGCQHSDQATHLWLRTASRGYHLYPSLPKIDLSLRGTRSLIVPWSTWLSRQMASQSVQCNLPTVLAGSRTWLTDRQTHWQPHYSMCSNRPLSLANDAKKLLLHHTTQDKVISVKYFVTLIILAFPYSNMVKLLCVKLSKSWRASYVLSKFKRPLLCKLLQKMLQFYPILKQ